MQKPGILLIDDAPFMFKLMSSYLTQKGFDIFVPQNFKEAQDLVFQEKIDIVIYSMGKSNPNKELFNRILKIDTTLPSIRLDPSQEYSDPTNVFQTEHPILRHLGPKDAFVNIVNRLIYVRNIKNEALRTNEIVEKVNSIQASIIGKSKQESYLTVLKFIASEFKSQNAFCWFYDKKSDPNDPEKSITEANHIFLKGSGSKESAHITSGYDSSRAYAENLKIENNYLHMPILNQEQNGNLCFFMIENPRGFETHKFSLFELVYKEIAHLIRIQEKFFRQQELTLIDDVTGLYNQRFLHTVLDQEIDKVKRDNTKFSVLFIDIDHFKSVNDKNGHLVGSQILNEIGKVLKDSVRTVDYCFRYGGDEFLIVLPGANTEHATTVAERIRKHIEITDFIIDGTKVHVTISIGIACFPDHAKTKKKIIQVADEAMYSGKNLTRNIVYVAS